MNSQPLWTLLMLAGLWLVLWLWRELRVDILRQELFAQRDRLFDMASSGAISFHHPAYGMLRSTLHGYIRFAHRISWFGVLVHVRVMRKEPVHYWGEQSWENAFEQFSKDLDPVTRRHLQGIRTLTHLYVLKHMVLISVPLTILSGVLVVGFSVASAVKRGVKTAVRSARNTVAETLRGLVPTRMDDAACVEGDHGSAYLRSA